MKNAGLFIFLLALAFISPVFSFAQEKPVRIIARPISSSSYYYDVVNLSQKAIKSFRLGYNYHQKDNESELTVEPTVVESPIGWEGYPVFVEESEYLHIYWHKLIDDHFIQPGHSVGGFIVHLSEPNALMMSATFTVNFSGGTRLAGIVEEIGNDVTPPSTSIFVNGAIGKDNWYSSNVEVTLNSTDTYSGVRELRYILDETAYTVSGSTGNILINNDGIHTLSYWAADNAGNIEQAKTIELKIDKTRPILISDASPAANANGWNNTDVSITFMCSDSLSGIASCPATAIATTEGAGQVITGTAVDKARNTASTSVALNIDKTLPVITASMSSQPNANGWHNTDVTITFTCSDTLSGISSCAAPATVTTEGAGQSVCGDATDNAGNTASTCVTLNIDKTGPLANISLTPKYLWPPNHRMVDVTVNGGASDSISGIASVVFTVRDEYGRIEPVINDFNTTISLEAWREGTDADGRHYTVTLKITDKADNIRIVSTEAVCPHDMRGVK